ncbi:putative phage tail protein [Clostridium sp.]|uniref:putative phage tail protein n=1 Tax=Clostridium sp. TaxID=1506 RepID=UPI002FDE4DCC
MSMKDDLINNLHQIYRNDEWIIEIFNSAGLSLDGIISMLLQMYNNYWFDTMDLDTIAILEKLLDFKTNPNTAIEDRRSQLEARWKSNNKCDLNLLKSIVNSWRNDGYTDVKFKNGRIQIIFTGNLIIPRDLSGLEKALEEIKPAHLDYDISVDSKQGLANIASYLVTGETITVYPWSPKVIESTGEINIAMGSNTGIENITVYPKEG